MRDRPLLHALAEQTEAEAAARGAELARLRLVQQAEDEARVLGSLAAGVRAGTVDPRSATAEGLEAMARGLRLLGGAAAAELIRGAVQPRPSTLWARLRWLLTGR